VQLEAGNADVSMAACFNERAQISKGAVTVRDIAGLYEYENTLVTLELTGQQLKDALEQSARYFKEYQPGKSLNDLVDSRIPGFNFDVAQGVKLRHRHYQTIRPADSESYVQRKAFIANPKTAGRDQQLSRQRRRWLHHVQERPGGLQISAEVRELIIDWVEKNKTIPVQTDNNWRIVGAN
jgi:2',3'-cyclic-nucleotide 2'-phosphodiesterase/3'-nucleotidase